MSLHFDAPPRPTATSADPFADSKCGGCMALCCRYFALEIDTPDEPEDFENLRWYLMHERTGLFIDDGAWYLQIFSPCKNLGADNRCEIYATRPNICREYTDESCDYDGVQSDETFRTVAELEAYRDTWVAEYEQEQAAAKARRKARRKKARRKARAAPEKSTTKARHAGGKKHKKKRKGKALARA